MISKKKCPACYAENFRIIALLDQKRRKRYKEFIELKYGKSLDSWINSIEVAVANCTICGHCWYKHHPNTIQLQQMYSSARSLEKALKTDRPKIISRQVKKLYQFCDQSLTKPSFLDYGSGSGCWAEAAVLKGFKVSAFEPSLKRSGASGSYELVSNLEQLKKNQKFDIINLEQVLEHISDPFMALNELRSYCKKNTIIRVTVPNLLRNPDKFKVWETWPFDGKSVHFLAPFEHLHGFTPRSLDKLLSRANYKRINSIYELRNEPLNYLRSLAANFIPIADSTTRFLKIS